MPLSIIKLRARLTKLRFVHTYEIVCLKELRLSSIMDVDREDLIPIALVRAAYDLDWLSMRDREFWEEWLHSSEEDRGKLLRKATEHTRRFVKFSLGIEFTNVSSWSELRVGTPFQITLVSQNPRYKTSKVIEEGTISNLVLPDA